LATAAIFLCRTARERMRLKRRYGVVRCQGTERRDDRNYKLRRKSNEASRTNEAEGQRRKVKGKGQGGVRIQKIPTYEYDDLYRLTTADYDIGGSTQSEEFVYDDLGNREYYYDHRNAVTTAYTDNVVNEYLTIEDVPGAAGPVSITHDAAGNLIRDENDYAYEYDYENRLTRVVHSPSGGPNVEVASFEYDALGRMVASTTRFDGESDAMTESLKFYHDGQNVLAEYDDADVIQRRYVHGTQRIDERAVLLVGAGESLDSYYYLLQELDTVTEYLAMRESAGRESHGVHPCVGLVDEIAQDSISVTGDAGYNPRVPAHPMHSCPLKNASGAEWHGLPAHEHTGRRPVPRVFQRLDRRRKR
jgi:hypothetical protein